MTEDNEYVMIEVLVDDFAMVISDMEEVKMNADEFQVHLVDINIMLIYEHMMQHDHRILYNQYHLMILNPSLKNFLLK
jgi:hypothetical protein